MFVCFPVAAGILVFPRLVDLPTATLNVCELCLKFRVNVYIYIHTLSIKPTWQSTDGFKDVAVFVCVFSRETPGIGRWISSIMRIYNVYPRLVSKLPQRRGKEGMAMVVPMSCGAPGSPLPLCFGAFYFEARRAMQALDNRL